MMPIITVLCSIGKVLESIIKKRLEFLSVIFDKEDRYESNIGQHPNTIYYYNY